MNFYIPKIGDTIQLIEPWRFSLYGERRNVGLSNYFNWKLASRNLLVRQENLAQVNVEITKIPYPRVNYQEFYENIPEGKPHYTGKFNRKKYNEAQRLNTELYHYLLSKTGGNIFVEVELPIGTILSIDRIYIKKGLSDFNSITFYAKNLENSGKGKKPKALRFWAKLEDCNNIEFEKIEKE